MTQGAWSLDHRLRTLKGSEVRRAVLALTILNLFAALVLLLQYFCVWSPAPVIDSPQRRATDLHNSTNENKYTISRGPLTLSSPDTEIRAVAIDGDGNTVITGSKLLSIHYSDNRYGAGQTWNKSTASFMQKISPAGTLIWERTSRGGAAIRTDFQNRIYAWALQGINVLTNTGELLWHYDNHNKKFSLQRFAVGKDGGIMALGIRFSCASAGGTGIWVARLDPLGGVLWERDWAGSEVFIRDAEVDRNGAAYVIGDFRGNLDLPGWELRSPFPSPQTFVAKVNAAGQVEWARAIQSVAVNRPLQLTTLADSSVVIFGYFQSEIELDRQPLGIRSLTGSDGYLVHLSATGRLLKAKGLKGPYIYQRGWQLASQQDGTIVMAAFLEGNTFVDDAAYLTTPTAPRGACDLAVMAFNIGFDYKWVHYFPAECAERNVRVKGLTVGLNDEIAILGEHGGELLSFVEATPQDPAHLRTVGQKVKTRDARHDFTHSTHFVLRLGKDGKIGKWDRHAPAPLQSSRHNEVSAQEGTPAALFNDWPIKPLQAAYIHNLRAESPLAKKIGLLVNVFKGIPPWFQIGHLSLPAGSSDTSVVAPPFEDDDRKAEYEKAYGAASSKHITLAISPHQATDYALKEPLTISFNVEGSEDKTFVQIPAFSCKDSRQKRLHLYVDKDGSTYYANTGGRCGAPLLALREALQPSYLATGKRHGRSRRLVR